ncbi:MAG: hypothetical protein CMF96_07760 [Candidatus Marinimicrobia bacterium]|nr:hypothetical protein [Candidatus Neomarinimicrobiota bacterium]|tara:strand:+ start:830 stop:1744 length:915 start_codon:yes stop_codon:yes gene_type:complete
MKQLKIIFIFYSLCFSEAIDQDKNIVLLDTIINNSTIKSINNKHNTILGRNNDPKLVSDISKFKLLIRKISWEIITLPGLRFLTNLIYPSSTISYFNVQDAVAFTIDDGFCGKNNSGGCMVDEVRQLLKFYGANATFFVTGSHCENINSNTVNLLLKDGNEIANHNMMDWSYENYSIDEFEFDLNLTENILSSYNQKYFKWYRAPFGKINNLMQKVIDKRKLVHVIPDTFAHDSYIPDPYWISKYILRKVRPGSIILIHMPERGVREWNYQAIKLTLQGLKNSNYKILNLTEINSLQNINSINN